MANKTKKHSPLKSSPLRQPGQSLSEKMADMVDEILLYLVYIVVFVFLALNEWSKLYFNTPPQPLFWTLVAVIVGIYSIIKIMRLWKKVRNYKLGRDGERIVGESLEKLREKGYKVFHDIVCEGFNIDHIIVGPGGVFIIETKTISKKNDSKISYDGVDIKIDGFTPDRSPIAQVIGQVYWLENFIAEHAKLKVKVKPVIVYPGWYVIQEVYDAEVWVLNIKALPSFLEKREVFLDQGQINPIASHIESYIRTIERINNYLIIKKWKQEKEIYQESSTEQIN